jgi:hypothetical protein
LLPSFGFDVLKLFFLNVVTHLPDQNVVTSAKTNLRRLIFVRKLLHVFWDVGKDGMHLCIPLLTINIDC